MKLYCFLILLLIIPFAIASDYVPTGRQDFQVYLDPAPVLSGYNYATVEIPSNNSVIIINLGGNLTLSYNVTNLDFECWTMLFAVDNSSGTPRYIHVQSNPPHNPPPSIKIGSEATGSRPEDLGYFPIKSGIGNVYFRSKDVVAYNQFLFVVKCNSNETQLIYEELLVPEYGEFGKSLPSRGAWFARSENASTFVLIATVALLIIMFIYYRFSR